MGGRDLVSLAGLLAQLVEHGSTYPKFTGSNPAESTFFLNMKLLISAYRKFLINFA